METVTWILQIVLAIAFLVAGAFKLSTPKAKLLENPNMAWTEDFSEAQVKAIGAIEVLGAIGLVLPVALDVVPVLTPIAAVGFVILMAAAARTHLRRGEQQALPVNLVLGLIALAIAILRFGPYPG
ncbi:MAG: DoxX family protein [Solirubrobacterales bacterium]|nr:DoxX family protein [Solirubrobacterales bacterium]